MAGNPIARCACQDFNRAEALRRAAAQAGRGLPAIEPGMPVPAGTGLSRRGFLLASAGLALSVYGAGRLLDPSRFEEGVAAAAAGPQPPVLVSVYLQGGIDSMSVLYPEGDPALPQVPPGAGAARRGGARLRRGPPPALASEGRPPGPAPRRGEGHRPAGGRLRRSRPVPLHEPPLLGGGGHPGGPAVGLDGPLPGHRGHLRQPPAGALPRRVPAAVAGDHEGAGRGDRSPLRLLLLRQGRVGSPAGDHVRLLRRPRAGRAALRGRRHVQLRLGGPDVQRPAPAAGPLPDRRRQKSCPPGTRAPATPSPPAWRPSRNCSAPGCRCAASASPRNPSSTPTTTQAAALETGLDQVCPDAAGIPARSRGPRARRPRADAGVVGVRSPRPGERLRRDRPWRRRVRLRDRHPRHGCGWSANGQGSPAAWTHSATCAPPRTSAASTAPCSSSGWARTRPP